MKIIKSLAAICLIIFLIFQGLINIGAVLASGFILLTGIFAILAGIFMIIAFRNWCKYCSHSKDSATCNHKDHSSCSHSDMDKKL